ncbi:hypothetical protein [Methanobrevibacter millerae]|uniref:Adhesin-like protein n=1 Tax=Methanobrevibacter millerae TaxID=230361 RepID=A0A1G5VHZ7_9EURY|nr:hypothetical protein [Methanobrevibacter millerae]SDA45472.1 hypothetical protein SAMN02910315_00628 [Methanobrevibacter millerae]
METKYLLILIAICVVCFAVFFYQFSNDVTTFIIINDTEVTENSTVTGFLVDAYSRGVENQTIYYHQAGDDKNTFVNVTTGKDGIFKIENIKNVPESGNNNYYGDITFKGSGEYQPCVFEYNLTVKA